MDKFIKIKKDLEIASSLFESQNMFIKISFLVWHFKSGNWKEKAKSRSYRNFVEEIETIFQNSF